MFFFLFICVCFSSVEIIFFDAPTADLGETAESEMMKPHLHVMKSKPAMILKPFQALHGKQLMTDLVQDACFVSTVTRSCN
jgi:hypothetical protein